MRLIMEGLAHNPKMSVNHYSGLKKLYFFIVVLALLGLSIKASGQCSIDVIGRYSGVLPDSKCAPSQVVVNYSVVFTTPTPASSYRVQFLWNYESGETNDFEYVWVTPTTSVVGGVTRYTVATTLSHSYTSGNLCEYTIRIGLMDNGYFCHNSSKIEEAANWHEDDVALANGFIRLTPEEKEVCEGHRSITIS